ncbi:MAG: TIGR00159 family protein [Acholeplasmatales bacterium]|nr:MAG: TIGR00159 family protein [Acholeplasmatales bacterium]
MVNIDVIIIHIYLLSIFTTLVKPKISTHLYRLLKFGVVALFVWLISALIPAGQVLAEPVEHAVRIVPLIVLVFVMTQTEVRLILRKIGVRTGLLMSNTIEEHIKTEIIDSVRYLSERRIGALITFERSDSLDEYVRHAIRLNAPLTSELLSTLFTPSTPLHDGAVILKGGTIVSAGSFFPSSENSDIPHALGSRHRAAIGISELTDALTIVVSEESGQISVTVDGYLDRDISEDSLRLYLEKYLQN